MTAARTYNEQAAGAASADASAGGERGKSIYWLGFLLVSHMVLARIEKGHSILVALHGLATLGVALVYGTDPRHPERTMQAVAYFCGAEIFWRVCAHSVPLPWEFSKYSVVLVLFAAIVRRGRVWWLPVVYFALLAPSVVMTLGTMDLSDARAAISNSLSGPLAIAACFAFMPEVSLTPRQACKTLLSFVLPITGVAFLCYSGTFGATGVTFGNASNKDASAGFGPNQVSAAFGFGMLCALFCMLLEKRRLIVRGMFLMVILWFGVQAGLTFSRTGLYLAGIGAGIAMLPLLKNARDRWAVLALAVTIFVVADFVVLPMLNRFTGGAFEERFENRNLTHRDSLMFWQLQVWMSSPVLGVGPGVVDSVNSLSAHRSHTEYTRMLAEHGTFGLAALVVLIGCVYRACSQASTPHARAFCWSMSAFGLLFMAVEGLRETAAPLALGLASVRLDPETRPEKRLVPPLSRVIRRRPRIVFALRPAGVRRGFRNAVQINQKPIKSEPC